MPSVTESAAPWMSMRAWASSMEISLVVGMRRGGEEMSLRRTGSRVRVSASESGRPSSTRLLGQPAHCLPIGDRESDIFELFCADQ